MICILIFQILGGNIDVIGRAVYTTSSATSGSKTYKIPNGYTDQDFLIIFSCTTNGHLLRISSRCNGKSSGGSTAYASTYGLTNLGSAFTGNYKTTVSSGDSVSIGYETNGTQTFYIELFIIAI